MKPCPSCGKDMRFYEYNNHRASGCTHMDRVPAWLANKMMVGDSAGDSAPLASLIERLERAITDLERHEARGYRK